MNDNSGPQGQPEAQQTVNSEPGPDNEYRSDHVAMMLRSYRLCTGSDLIKSVLPPLDQAAELFRSPIAVVSHGIEDDPIFNYANQTAMSVFELSWNAFTTLPSRLSAEPVHRDERARLLAGVAEKGYIDNYRGVRIASSGRRFWIEDAVVWNLTDEAGRRRGQAAAFRSWRHV